MSGTLLSSDSVGKLVIGSKTLTPETETGGLGGVILGAFGLGGQHATGLASTGSISSSGDGNGADVQAFEGNAKMIQSSPEES